VGEILVKNHDKPKPMDTEVTAQNTDIARYPSKFRVGIQVAFHVLDKTIRKRITKLAATYDTSFPLKTIPKKLTPAPPIRPTKNIYLRYEYNLDKNSPLSHHS